MINAKNVKPEQIAVRKKETRKSFFEELHIAFAAIGQIILEYIPAVFVEFLFSFIVAFAFVLVTVFVSIVEKAKSCIIKN